MNEYEVVTKISKTFITRRYTGKIRHIYGETSENDPLISDILMIILDMLLQRSPAPEKQIICIAQV